MATSHLIAGAGDAPAHIIVRRIGFADLVDALRLGLDDFKAMPTHAVFLGIIYPVVGLMLGRLAFGHDVLPLLFPLAAGFALLGPLAAIGLYEMSRRRELGLPVNWSNALDVLRSPSIGAIAALGVLLLLIFLVWLAAAQAIYVSAFGYIPAASIPDFVNKIFNTPEGWHLIVWGNGIGFLFAVAVLILSAVSFPLLLDRDVGVAVATLTSIRAFATNPGAMTAWGFIVAALLVIGSLPFLLGLTVVMPVLAHATWHLYRKVVEPNGSPRNDPRAPRNDVRHAADFPASLFPWTREKQH